MQLVHAGVCSSSPTTATYEPCTYAAAPTQLAFHELNELPLHIRHNIMYYYVASRVSAPAELR